MLSDRSLVWKGWRDLHIIYDLNTAMYTCRELWRDADDEPEWADPEEGEL